MSRTALPGIRRATVAVSLVGGITLGVVGLLLQPAFADDPSEYVRVLADSPTAGIALQLFAFSQVFWAIGLIGLAHAASHRARVTSVIGAVLGGLGAFGHAVFAGASLVGLAMAEYAVAAGDPEAALAAAEATQGGAFTPFLACGLLGTVLGVVFVAIATLRARTAPLWVPIAMFGWVAVEFVLSNFLSGEWMTYASGVLGVIAFGGAAVAIWRGGRGPWTTVREAELETAPDATPVQTATA